MLPDMTIQTLGRFIILSKLFEKEEDGPDV